MNELPEEPFANPVWHALHSRHRKFAQGAGAACRYPTEVVPFAATRAAEVGAMIQLRSLFEAGESAWVIGKEYAGLPGLVREETLECLQMVLPDEVHCRIQMRSRSCRMQTLERWCR
jgi:hypothetical protein